jgi:hypothetical protein
MREISYNKIKEEIMCVKLSLIDFKTNISLANKKWH